MLFLCPIKVCKQILFFKSQILTVQLAEPETTLPSNNSNNQYISPSWPSIVEVI